MASGRRDCARCLRPLANQGDSFAIPAAEAVLSAPSPYQDCLQDCRRQPGGFESGPFAKVSSQQLHLQHMGLKG